MTSKSIVKCMSVACLLGFASSALADKTVLEADLTACLQNGTKVGGVNSCGKIWKLSSGEAKLQADGTLKVEVKGLVLNDTSVGEFNGTPDGVTGVAAAVICSGSAGESVAAQTDVAPLSKKGDAKISAKVALPTGCVGPIVVLREQYEGKIGGWLAATGM